MKERLNTGGGVVAPVGVAKERSSTVGGVADAGCIFIERLKTNGRVVSAGAETEERSRALRSIPVRIASIRCGANRLRR